MPNFIFTGQVLNENYYVNGTVMVVHNRIFIVCVADIDDYGEGNGVDLYATEFYEVEPETIIPLEKEMEQKGSDEK
ncbi:hypothetical protein HCA73_16155 [Listeria booriae]|uniref:hypothetical protein n=1 Tax=Listeria booriae TaxID=1552123 RepID=UPI00162ADDF2|nr:hypothetical protein [Listeria booriae]MBC1914186.1 hypothetical protein [Listeria booriae]